MSLSKVTWHLLTHFLRVFAIAIKNVIHISLCGQDFEQVAQDPLKILSSPDSQALYKDTALLLNWKSNAAACMFLFPILSHQAYHCALGRTYPSSPVLTPSSPDLTPSSLSLHPSSPDLTPLLPCPYTDTNPPQMRKWWMWA